MCHSSIELLATKSNWIVKIYVNIFSLSRIDLLAFILLGFFFATVTGCVILFFFVLVLFRSIPFLRLQFSFFSFFVFFQLLAPCVLFIPSSLCHSVHDSIRRVGHSIPVHLFRSVGLNDFYYSYWYYTLYFMLNAQSRWRRNDEKKSMLRVFWWENVFRRLKRIELNILFTT